MSRSFSVIVIPLFVGACYSQTGGSSRCEQATEDGELTYCVENISTETDVRVFTMAFRPEQFDAEMDDGGTFYIVFLEPGDSDESYFGAYLNEYTLWTCVPYWEVEAELVALYLGEDSSLIIISMPFGNEGALEDQYCLGPSEDNDATP